MKDLNLGILDKNLNLIGVLDNIINFQITSNLSKCSVFTLQLVLTKENCKILDVDNFLIINSGRNITEAYIIEYKDIQLNNSGNLQLKVQGRNLLSLLDRRVITKLWNLNDDISNISNQIISNEILKADDLARNISNLSFDLVNLNTNASYANTTLYSNLLNELTDFLSSYDIGLTILLDIKQKCFIIKLIKGTNRTLVQKNTQPVIFSNSLNNIMSENFLHSTKDFVNTCYVYGQIGSKNIEELVISKVNSKIGINRYETSINCNQQGLTDSTFSSAFKNYGDILIKNRDLKKCFSANFNIESEIKYSVDFNLGDFITCISSEWNINDDLQIIQVTETWNNTGYSLNFQLGSNLPTLSEQLRKLNK